MENQARAVPLLQKVMSVAINMLLYLHGIWSIKFVHCSIRHLSTMGEDLQVSLLEYIKRVSGDLLLKRKFISSIATMKKVFDQIVRDLKMHIGRCIRVHTSMDCLVQAVLHIIVIQTRRNALGHGDHGYSRAAGLVKNTCKTHVRAFVNSKNEVVYEFWTSSHLYFMVLLRMVLS
ncbi:uncharacterized protein LOC131249998 isoform X2 [Magnolia sinica]|uniref:uncharacterized protein LOC131249998 isoform X2 n=1 Tax=Magnolia sinica TaxID=86752 RepID=UPI0026592788|nr:uncharacterized protein LOC131249998 isoform X2 [Magnolia sinica]